MEHLEPTRGEMHLTDSKIDAGNNGIGSFSQGTASRQAGGTQGAPGEYNIGKPSVTSLMPTRLTLAKLVRPIEMLLMVRVICQTHE